MDLRRARKGHEQVAGEESARGRPRSAVAATTVAVYSSYNSTEAPRVGIPGLFLRNRVERRMKFAKKKKNSGNL